MFHRKSRDSKEDLLTIKLLRIEEHSKKQDEKIEKLEIKINEIQRTHELMLSMLQVLLQHQMPLQKSPQLFPIPQNIPPPQNIHAFPPFPVPMTHPVFVHHNSNPIQPQSTKSQEFPPLIHNRAKTFDPSDINTIKQNYQNKRSHSHTRTRSWITPEDVKQQVTSIPPPPHSAREYREYSLPQSVTNDIKTPNLSPFITSKNDISKYSDITPFPLQNNSVISPKTKERRTRKSTPKIKTPITSTDDSSDSYSDELLINKEQSELIEIEDSVTESVDSYDWNTNRFEAGLLSPDSGQEIQEIMSPSNTEEEKINPKKEKKEKKKFKFNNGTYHLTTLKEDDETNIRSLMKKRRSINKKNNKKKNINVQKKKNSKRNSKKDFNSKSNKSRKNGKKRDSKVNKNKSKKNGTKFRKEKKKMYQLQQQISLELDETNDSDTTVEF